jgi:hypothetical protein
VRALPLKTLSRLTGVPGGFVSVTRMPRRRMALIFWRWDREAEM